MRPIPTTRPSSPAPRRASRAAPSGALSWSTRPTPESEGPTGRAFLTGEAQTARNISADPSYEPWRDSAAEHGFRSSVAIQIAHEGTVYGVLNVYTDRADVFTDEEYDVIGLLGKIVGHAISSIDRRQVLLADSVVDLEFWVSEHAVFGTTDSGKIDLVDALLDVREQETAVSLEVLVTDLPFLSAISATGERFVEAVIVEGDL